MLIAILMKMRPMLKIVVPNNENEFMTMMEIVDAFLRSQEIPIHARPMRGWFEISKTLQLGLSLFPRQKTIPSPGVYTGDDLSLRIFAWFDERYGKRLAIRSGPGRMAISIRGDVWELHFPRIYGTVLFFISQTIKSSDIKDDLRSDVAPKVNIFSLITEFPVGLAQSLNPMEMNSIAESFKQCFDSMQAIEEIQQLPLVKEIFSDIDSAANHLLTRPGHYGLSKYASLQVAEKSFKIFLASKGVSFPKVHELQKLSKLAESHGLFPVELQLIAKIQCGAGVRYGEEQVSLIEAQQAHELSILLAGRIAKVVAAATKTIATPP